MQLKDYDSAIFLLAITASIFNLDDVETTKAVLLDAADKNQDRWMLAIKTCCRYGRPEILKAILREWVENTKPELLEQEIQECLQIAAEHGSWPVVSQLIDVAKMSHLMSHSEIVLEIIKTAAQYGRDGIVHEMIQKTEEDVYEHESSKTPDLQPTGGGAMSGNDAQDLKDNAQAGERNAPEAGTMQGEQDDEESSSVHKPTEGSQDIAITRTRWLSEALFQAVEFGSEAVVKILLDNGATSKCTTIDGLHWTPPHVAAYEGNSEAMEQVLDHDADLECTDDQGATPLMVASLSNHSHTAGALLARGSNPDHIAIESHKYRALHIAARNGNSDLVRLLLESGASEDPRLAEPEQSTPLHLAVSWSDGSPKHVKVVQTLCEFGADPNGAAQHGRTPIHMAVENAHCDKDVVLMLLRYGASIDKEDDKGLPPLYYAIRNGSNLVQHLWNPDNSSKLKGVPVLFHAAATGNLARVKQLIAAGVDQTEKDKWGRTALDVAAAKAVRQTLRNSDNADKEGKDEADRNLTEAYCPSLGKRFTGDYKRLAGWNCDKCKTLLDGVLFYHCFITMLASINIQC
ncbi:hypothetical protein FOMG_09741 [Fusarium oxysporum f. sp. melonis 26406]|uniref:Uncharacterized protein n=1 Tax=Fusarium oxysporum f. sp. melonis 26406 TaxID=1089452 RepID=X0A6V1_FUSOX|nr:hypothetical protein FOMG_09741 [Fusarium oxysporum f. sp. melonis 26406]